MLLSVHIKGKNKQCDLLFDCGNLDDHILSARHVFITHGHIDHIGACISHARAKSLNPSPVTYYVPLSCLDGLVQAKQAFEILEGKEIPMKIVGIAPNEPVQIMKSYKVFAFPTTHRVPSQGYSIVHCQHGALLPSYLHYTPQQLSSLHKQQIPTNSVIETVEVVYTGDTIFSALLSPDLSFVFTAEILLIEMTYLDGDRQKVAKHCHVHLDDFIEHIDMFRNRQIIFMHLSSRYGTGYRVLDTLRRRLPEKILTKCAVGLKCFGFNQSVTPLTRSEQRRRVESGGREEDIEEVLFLSDQCLPCDATQAEASEIHSKKKKKLRKNPSLGEDKDGEGGFVS
jgi:ribonuclease Z